MARVSLIILRSPGIAWPSDRVSTYRSSLQDLGYPVEVVVVADPAVDPSTQVDEHGCASVVTKLPGLTESAIAGIRAARGSLLIVVDLARAYSPAEVVDVVETLAKSGASLVVACQARRWTGRWSQRFLGTTDPTSGLVGLTQEAAIEADDSFSPVGSLFTLELLARVAGKRVDVAVGPVRAESRSTNLFGDIRHLKRLADDRFGNASRLLQFCFVGASGMVVDLTFYAILQAIFARTAMAGMIAPMVGGSLALAMAAVLAIAIALTWNFSINRRLTFNDARRGSVGRQYLRYVLSNLLGIGVSLSLRLFLPNTFGFFRRHRLAAAVVGIVAATGISFSMARWFVFGQRPSPSPSPSPSQTTTKDRPARMTKRRCDGFRPMNPNRQHRHRPEVQAAYQNSSQNVAN